MKTLKNTLKTRKDTITVTYIVALSVVFAAVQTVS